jgi:hypothetical protein
MLLDVVLSPGGSVRVDVPQGWSSFAYVCDGEPQAYSQMKVCVGFKAAFAYNCEGVMSVLGLRALA